MSAAGVPLSTPLGAPPGATYGNFGSYGGFAVGNEILINKKYRAVIRYIGTTAFKEGVWVGVELEKEKGKHNGTIYGVTYFNAKPNHGTFVSMNDIMHFDPAAMVAATVQASSSSTERRRAEREAYQRASVALEADEESKHLLRRQLLQETLLGATLNRARPEASAVEQWEAEAESMAVETSYTGPHISFPLTLEQVVTMMEAFKAGKSLHFKYAMQLVSAYRRYAAELPTLVEVDVAAGTRLTICGDTHGQLKDLFAIYTINGIPSLTNRYLMNGDFVDRGDFSCEIMFTLIAFNLLYPGEARTSRGGACLLNRGNHEAHNQNMTQGFMSEVLEKYSGMLPPSKPTARSNAIVESKGAVERGLRMYDMFLLAFDCMPLAHLVRGASGEKKVFVVHGGLMQSPGVRLAHIAALKRKREIPYGYPGFEDKLYEDLMWSDPRPVKGTSPNTRGAGVYFGPDITQRFCATNGLSLVIRSHECVQEGYQFMHDDRLITVFSASQYCGRDTNRGAFIVFDSAMNMMLQQYVAGSLALTSPALKPPAPGRSSAGVYATGSETVATAVAPVVIMSGTEMDAATECAQEENVRRMIMERVVLHKPDLYWFFSHADNASTRDGRVTKVQWAEGMRTVLNLDLPWITLANSLAEVEADGRIAYVKFLDRYHIAVRESDMRWMEGIVERVCTTLYAAFPTVEAAYAYFDTDASGEIDLDEMQKGLEKLDVGLSRPQLVDFMNSMDVDKDGRIQVSEFAARFRVVFARQQEAATAVGVPVTAFMAGDAAKSAIASARDVPSMSAFVRTALDKIGTALFKPGTTLGAVFERIDVNRDGILTLEEFGAGLREAGLSFNDAELRAIVDTIDLDKSGTLNYAEFVKAFKVADTGAQPGSARGATEEVDTSIASRSWQQSVLERIIATLWEYRLELASAFRLFDTDGNGVISKEEFRQGLQALTSMTGSTITDMQADELMTVLDKNGDGSINFEEFVEAFKLVDNNDASSPPAAGAGGAAASATPPITVSAGSGGRA